MRGSLLSLLFFGLSSFNVQAQSINDEEIGFQNKVAKIYFDLEANEDQKGYLEYLFDFSKLKKDNMLPPVIKNDLSDPNFSNECSESNPCSVVKSATPYCIETPNKSGCTPITWRNYVYKDFPNIEVLKVNMNLPTIDSDDYRKGEERAEQLYDRNLEDLESTYLGMMSSRNLEGKDLITVP